MSALAIGDHRAEPGRRALVAAVALLALTAALLVAAVELTDGGVRQPVSPATVQATETTPTDAIDGWLTAHRDVFPGAEGTDVGTCPAITPSTPFGLCSSLQEDLGEVQLHTTSGLVGQPADVAITLRTSPDRTWTVIDVAELDPGL